MIVMPRLLKNVLLIALLFFSECAFIGSSTDVLIEIRDYYYSQNPSECMQIYEPGSDRVKQIVLVRHGEPDLEHDGWRTRKEAVEDIQQYDSAGVKPFDTNPVCTQDLDIEKVYHSNLERSRHTAHLIFEDQAEYVEKPLFRELERQIIPFFDIKMPGGFWSAVSRIFWFFGANDDEVETARKAEQRVIEGAELLASEASEEGLVILVSHGLLNEFLVRQLEKEGWHEVFDGGNDFLAVRIVAQVENES